MLSPSSAFIRKTVKSCFKPLFDKLRVMYALHLSLVGKLVVNFLSVFELVRIGLLFTVGRYER